MARPVPLVRFRYPDETRFYPAETSCAAGSRLRGYLRQ